MASLYTHCVRTVRLRETWGLARDEFTINMAPILSLPEECLCKIVSFIDHPRTFYRVALTCKRLLQVTRNTRCVLHARLLKFKALYFIRRYDVETDLDEEKRDKMRKLVCGYAQLTKAREFLTYDKVIDLWQKNGPVAAKLLTWVRNQQDGDEVFFRDDWDGFITINKNQTLTLRLPGGGQTLVIETDYVEEYPIEEDSKITMIHITSEDLQLDVTLKEFHCWSSVSFHDDYGQPKYLDCVDLDDDVHLSKYNAKFAPLRPVIHILQKELGETVPPITSYFFIWLCYFFPDASNLDEAHRLSFKDAGRNVKPSYASVQPAINEFQQDQQIETKLERLVAELNREEDQKSKYSSLCAEAVRTLSQRSEAKILKQLEEHAPRFRSVVTDYDMRELPKELLLDLVLRTSLEKRGYRPGAIADKYVEGTVYFRCVGGKLMKVHGSMHGDGASYPTWDEMELKFTLPDGNVLSLEGRNRPLQIEDLTPVTELLRQGVSQRMQEEKHIPNFGNLFTAAFFLSALGMNVDSETFLGRYDKLIPSESEDESSAEELSESAEELSESADELPGSAEGLSESVEELS